MYFGVDSYCLMDWNLPTIENRADPKMRDLGLFGDTTRWNQFRQNRPSALQHKRGAPETVKTG